MGDEASQQTKPGPDTRWGGVVAEVSRHSEQRHRGTLTDVARNVVEIDFLRSDSPGLPITERVRITFSGDSMLEPLRAGGRVISRAETDGSDLYGFSLDKEVGEILSAGLARRSTFRVAPCSSEHVYVDLKSGGASRAAA